MGEGDRPGLKRELVEVILDVADIGMDDAHPVYLFDSAEGIDDSCPACGESISESATECPGCGLALLTVE